MPPESPPFQLHEPDLIESLLPGWWLPHILIGSTILIALMLAAVLLVRAKNRPRPVDPAKLREDARLKAVSALESARASSATPREAAVFASLALRGYLARAADDPALFETHEEFIARRDSLAALHEKARESAAAGFSHLASLKYAAEPPASTATEVIESARTLLDELHRGFVQT
jgi:hypothetical protein